MRPAGVRGVTPLTPTLGWQAVRTTWTEAPCFWPFHPDAEAFLISAELSVTVGSLSLSLGLRFINDTLFLSEGLFTVGSFFI